MDKRERGAKMAAKAGKGAEKCAKRRKDRKRAMWKACGRALWNAVEKEGGCGEKKQEDLSAARRTREKKDGKGEFHRNIHNVEKSFPGYRHFYMPRKAKKQAVPCRGTAEKQRETKFCGTRCG